VQSFLSAVSVGDVVRDSWLGHSSTADLNSDDPMIRSPDDPIFQPL
jgi:hypothetical protein